MESHSILLKPIYFAVRFYGKDKPTEVKLPLKTDHDTLREGYRYGALLYNVVSCWNSRFCFLWLQKNGFLRFVFVSSHLFGNLFVCLLMKFGVFTCKGLYVLKKMIWTLLGSKGWWSDTMISFLRSILYHIELLRYNLFKVTSTFFVVVRVLMSSCLFISLTDLRYCIADMSRYKTGQV